MRRVNFRPQFDPVQPKRGDVLLKCAAYNRCGALGPFDYTRKSDEHAGGYVLLPPGSPSWAADPEALWNAAQAAETRKDGQPARLVHLPIPREVPPERRMDFAVSVAQAWADEGAAVQIDLHNPQTCDGADEQPHVHLIVSRRAMRPDGFDPGHKLPNDPWTKGKGRAMRDAITARANAWLEASNIQARCDCRSAEERGELSPEQSANRKSVKAWKKDPQSKAAAQFARVLEERPTRRRQRAEWEAVQEEKRQADAELAALKMAKVRAPDATISPPSPEARQWRKQKFLAAKLASFHDRRWVDPAEVEGLSGVYSKGEALLLFPQGGGRIVDDGQRLTLHGQPSPRAIAEMVSATRREGWRQVELAGSREFRLSAAMALGRAKPPIEIAAGLDATERGLVAKGLAQEAARMAATQRAAQEVPKAPAPTYRPKWAQG